MLRMTPPPCRSMIGTAARAPRNTPFTFTLIQAIEIRFRRLLDRADVRDAGVVDQDVEAAVTRGHRAEHVGDAFGARDVADLRLGGAAIVKDSGNGAPRGGSSTSSTTTRACWLANRRAMAAPMPEPAPVTTATLPGSWNTVPGPSVVGRDRHDLA